MNRNVNFLKRSQHILQRIRQLVRRCCQGHQGGSDDKENQSHRHFGGKIHTLVGDGQLPEMNQRPSFRKKQIEDDRNHQNHHDCLHAAHDITEGHMRCCNHDCHGHGCYEIPRPGMHDKK